MVFSGGTTSATVTHPAPVSDPEYIMTLQELKDFEPVCNKQQEQLKQLRNIQVVKNFKEDPNDLDANDRAYNSRLKATIWWYTYSCEQS
jgi:hypothetical protein